MTAAMLVIVAVQVSWLESSAKLRKEVFDQSIEQSLQLVANWLTATHLDDPQTEDPQLLRTDELAPEERLIVRRMEALPMDSLLRLAFQEQRLRRTRCLGHTTATANPCTCSTMPSPSTTPCSRGATPWRWGPCNCGCTSPSWDAL